MKSLPQHIRQTALCLLIIIATAFICFYLKENISYRIVAIILLFVVSVLAVTLDIIPVLIADNGNGVSNEILPFIFDKFYRGLQTKTGGTGLGLSIVKGYIEAHSDTVKAFSNNPSGLIIEISLSVKISYINKL